MESLWIPMCFAAAGLWRLGGKINKAFRRFGIPLFFLGIIIAVRGYSLQALLATVLYSVLFHQPFTTIGKDINDHWLNWPLIYVWAFFLPLPAVLVDGRVYFLCFLMSGIIALCATLSNLQVTRNIFVWGFCELVFGAAVAFPLGIALQS